MKRQDAGQITLSEGYQSATIAEALVFQLCTHHSPALGSFLKSAAIAWTAAFTLMAVGAIPLIVLEMIKVLRRHLRAPRTGR